MASHGANMFIHNNIPKHILQTVVPHAIHSCVVVVMGSVIKKAGERGLRTNYSFKKKKRKNCKSEEWRRGQSKQHPQPYHANDPFFKK